MDLVIALIAIEIIASKFLISYISTYRSEGSFEEKNPFLKFLLGRLNVNQDEWLSFFCTILLVGLTVFLLNSFHFSIMVQLVFVITGFYITILNLASAHSYYFRKNNFITRKLL